MVATGIHALCMLSNAFISGFCYTKDWANPALAALGLTDNAVELFGSNTNLSKEFQLATQAATKKTAKHFRNPDYKIRDLDALFNEVDTPKNLTELLEQMETQQNKFKSIKEETDAVVRFFDVALQIEVANYPALSRYYLLMGDRINQSNLEKLVHFEEKNKQIAEEILGDVKMISENCLNNGEGIQTLLKRSQRMENRWLKLDKAAEFWIERLVNSTIIFAVFLFTCLVSACQYSIDVLGLLTGLVVLSEVIEYCYYKKYQEKIHNVINVGRTLLLDKKSLNIPLYVQTFKSTHLKSVAVEAILQALILMALTLFATRVTRDFDKITCLWMLLGMSCGVLVKYVIQAMHLCVTPSIDPEGNIQSGS